MQQKRITQYFPGGNTALGFYSYWDSNINDLDRLIILKGGPGTGKSTLLDKILREFAAEDWETELLWCSSDAESLAVSYTHLDVYKRQALSKGKGGSSPRFKSSTKRL